jgi:hypothetical protein
MPVFAHFDTPLSLTVFTVEYGGNRKPQVCVRIMDTISPISPFGGPLVTMFVHHDIVAEIFTPPSGLFLLVRNSKTEKCKRVMASTDNGSFVRQEVSLLNVDHLTS